MKNKLPILFLLPTLLCSCSASSYKGTYSFQMGKEDGTHMGAKLNLTDKIVTKKDETTGQDIEKGYEFKLTISMDFNMLFSSILSLIPEYQEAQEKEEEQAPANGGESSGEETPSEEGEDDEKKMPQDIEIGGYYRVGEKNRDNTHHLYINVYDPSIDTEIDDELLEHIMYATITHKEVTIKIPVSLTDLALQLYWYGFDFNFDTFEFIEVEAHPFGTHPTLEEVEAINASGFPKTHTIPFLETKLTYRDFYTVDLSLTRE